MKVSASFIIKSSQTGPALGPTSRTRIHPEDEILFLFEEIDPISRVESNHPPFKICTNGGIDESSFVRERRGQSLGSKKSGGEKSARPNH